VDFSILKHLKACFLKRRQFVFMFPKFLYNNKRNGTTNKEGFLMKTIQYKDMGARIRAQRERLGYTREQLAEKLDVSTKFCSDIELGIKGISIQTLAKLSDLLCLRTDYILFGEEQPDHTAELEMMDALIQKCPPNHQDDLLTMIHAFIHAVSEPQEPTE
jgi:transcriptional regulator with XRE-family HTH domain